MDCGKYRSYEVSPQPDCSRACVIQVSTEESPIGGVGGSYQERVRLPCISENLDIGPLSCRSQTCRFQVGVQAEAQITRYKARLVARGLTQEKGMDYHETFAPTVRVISIRTLSILSVQVGFRRKVQRARPRPNVLVAWDDSRV
jgi:hypothetical protein